VRFVLVEEWRDQAGLDAHLQLPHVKGAAGGDAGGARGAADDQDVGGEGLMRRLGWLLEWPRVRPAGADTETMGTTTAVPGTETTSVTPTTTDVPATTTSTSTVGPGSTEAGSTGTNRRRRRADDRRAVRGDGVRRGVCVDVMSDDGALRPEDCTECDGVCAGRGACTAGDASRSATRGRRCAGTRASMSALILRTAAGAMWRATRGTRACSRGATRWMSCTC
jgi:hypothetical protein